jgi:hypothetical protein
MTAIAEPGSKPYRASSLLSDLAGRTNQNSFEVIQAIVTALTLAYYLVFRNSYPRVGGVVQVVERPPCKCETLNSNHCQKKKLSINRERKR